VTSANQLVEKIQIFDAGKDDRVMEFPLSVIHIIGEIFPFVKINF